ncbi:hypothetical protein N9O21_06575 [Rhodobacteraceae bacterium]|nr:hypothetical protein [Paracoccaceae bacterium]
MMSINEKVTMTIQEQALYNNACCCNETFLEIFKYALQEDGLSDFVTRNFGSNSVALLDWLENVISVKYFATNNVEVSGYAVLEEEIDGPDDVDSIEWSFLLSDLQNVDYSDLDITYSECDIDISTVLKIDFSEVKILEQTKLVDA